MKNVKTFWSYERHERKKMFLFNFYIIQGMILILDGNLEHVAHALRKIGLFGEKISDL